MARRPSRQIVLVLEADDYRLLEDEAKRWERDPWSQARWMLTRLLRSGASVEEDASKAVAS